MRLEKNSNGIPGRGPLKTPEVPSPRQALLSRGVENPAANLPSPASFAVQHGVKFGMTAGTTYFPSAEEIEAMNTALFKAPDDFSLLVPDYRGSLAGQSAVRKAIESPNTAVSESVIKTFAKEKLRATNVQNLTKGLLPISSREALRESKRFFREIQSEASPVIDRLRCLGVSEQGLKVFKTFIAKAAPMMELAGFPEAIPHSMEVAVNCANLAQKLGASHVEILQSAMTGAFHDGLKVPPAISFINLATHPAILHAASKHLLLQDPEMKAEIIKYLSTLNGDVPKTPEAFAKPISDALIINNDSKWVTENVIAKTLRKGLEGTEAEALIPKIEELLLKRFSVISTGKRAPQFTPEMLEAIQSVQFETGLFSIDRSALNAALEVLSREHAAIFPENMKPLEAILNGKLNGKIEQKQAFLSALQGRLQSAGAICGVDVTGLAVLGNSREMPGNMAAQILGDIDQLSLRASKIIKTENEKFNLWQRLSNAMHSISDNANGVSPLTRETAQLRRRDVFSGIFLALQEVTGNNLAQDLPQNFKNLSSQEQGDCLRDLIVGPVRQGEDSLNSVRHRWLTRDGVDLTSSLSEKLIQAIEEYENHAVREGETVYRELVSKIDAPAAAPKEGFAY